MQVTFTPANAAEYRLVGDFFNKLAELHDPATHASIPSEVFEKFKSNVDAMQDNLITQHIVNPAAGPIVPKPADVDDAPSATPPAFDANGLPWDDRIHSSSKAVNKDGTWRYRKGVQEHVVTAVEAELKGRLLTPATPPAPAAAVETVAVAPVPVPTATVLPFPTAPAVPVQVPVAAPAPAPQPEPTGGLTVVPATGVDWPTVCIAMQEALARGVTIEKMNGVAASLGLPVLALGASRPDLHAQLHAALQAIQA